MFATSGFTGNNMETPLTLTLRQGYNPYVIGLRPNNYNSAHYISYHSQPNAEGLFYIEHNLNPNATLIDATILWVPTA